MFNKVKKMFKNEKGFTLVELLAVIVILGIITAVAVPAIGSILDGKKQDVHEANCQLVSNAARLAAVEDNIGDSTDLATLKTEGFLEEIPEDPNSGNLYGENTGVIKNNDGKYIMQMEGCPGYTP
ncbi:competence type IV pilus major pilin ComGC [Virgibacillus sp. W0181]|uniref:competence type IV pilus major pilin ComGC n=1 Tax=Virgibacillus sp. W0181 TaxID=3391581 RepID=UPI003F48427D